MTAYDNKNKGAIWSRTAKSWLAYKSWTLNVEGKEYEIAIFDNDKKWNENRPDYNITIKPKEDTQAQDISWDDSIPF